MGQTLHKMDYTKSRRKTSVYAGICAGDVFIENEKSRHGYGDTHVGMNEVEAVRRPEIRARRNASDAGEGKLLVYGPPMIQTNTTPPEILSSGT